jgi:hypothetical protein
VRYLPQSLISDVPRIVAGLRVGQSFGAILVPEPPVIRRGASGTFYDKGLEGASHHAVIPNVNTIDKLREAWPRLSSDEKKLFDVIARAYLAALMPDFRYRQTTATLDVRGLWELAPTLLPPGTRAISLTAPSDALSLLAGYVSVCRIPWESRSCGRAMGHQ